MTVKVERAYSGPILGPFKKTLGKLSHKTCINYSHGYCNLHVQEHSGYPATVFCHLPRKIEEDSARSVHSIPRSVYPNILCLINRSKDRPR